MAELDSPLNQAARYIRNTVSQSPDFGDQWKVINIESAALKNVLLLRLDNGDMIRLDIKVYPKLKKQTPKTPLNLDSLDIEELRRMARETRRFSKTDVMAADRETLIRSIESLTDDDDS